MKYSCFLGGLVLASRLFGQVATQPPQVSFVTVNPVTEQMTVAWYKSPDNAVEFISLKCVTGLKPVPNGYGFAKIGVNSDSSYTFDVSNLQSVNTDRVQQSFTFSVSARATGKSESASFDRGHSTIYATCTFKTCPSQMVISWSPYAGKGSTVLRYNVYDFNQGKPVKVGSVDASQTSYSQLLTSGSGDFCYFVEAELTDVKGKPQKSTSNKTCDKVKIPRMPAYIIADYASASSDSTIDLSFSLDTACDIKHYTIMKSNSFKGPYAPVDSGDFKKITSPQLLYTDKGKDLATKRNFYKIYAIGECGDSILASNVASNIVLEIKDNPSANVLTWTGYQEWPQGVDRYEILRSIDGGSYEHIKTEQRTAETINYIDMIDKIAQDGKTTCYYVMAYPRNPKNPASKSQSNKVCITRETRIFVPDAFNPTSPVQKNRIFSVGSSFVNTSSYEMIIYDRWGAVMFKTNKQDEGWDGTYKGKLVSEGTYIYRIRFENSSGKTEDKRGTFNVIYKD